MPKFKLPKSLQQYIAQFVRGFLMGGADIIPGVSGGTVALILGIYERLLGSISRFDTRLVWLLAKGKYYDAAEHIDLRFLAPLGLGILTGIACLAKLMRYLLLEQRMYTLATFFGLILASSVVVMKLVRPTNALQRAGCALITVLSAVFAYWLVGLEQVGFHDHLAYYFVCGAIAICAMILPGISGSYILLLLGAYVAVTGIIENLIDRNFSIRDLMAIGIFATGCGVGLIGFSKLLKWLLARAKNPVMAGLGGFMIGSLRLMWPFQVDLTPDVTKLKLKRFAQIAPDTWNTDVTVCLAIAIVAAFAVLMLEHFGGGKKNAGSDE